MSIHDGSDALETLVGGQTLMVQKLLKGNLKTFMHGAGSPD
jgi:hypothetical protein